ncbi:MAG: heavy metal translocating P-type ATPase [Pirellulales bacterium]|nr:heavy metal translocating P-type ATPase [Pirellulales bacterium]
MEQRQREGACPRFVCAHCGLPVPAGLIDPSQPAQFCCQGCRAVYEMIRGCGLDRFYRLRDAVETSGIPARTTHRKYSEFDDAVFRDLYCQALADGTQSVELYLEGVHCAACVWLIEKLPGVLPGVIESRLDLRRALVHIRWNPSQVGLAQIARTLDSLGYPPHPAKDARRRELRRQEDRRFLIRIGVAAACTGNVMTLAFALYGGVFTGIEAQYAQLFRWASMAIGMIALVWPGSLFFRGAWAAIRTRTAHLDVPIALGLLAGGAAGILNVVRGRGEIYFDSLTMLVLLLLAGRWLQRRQHCWANDAVELLFSLTPTSARRIEGDRVVNVPLEALQPDEVVEILAGDSVPADGTVLEGRSSVDQALLTGESRPVPAVPGDRVYAGTLNGAARLLVRVETVGEQTRAGRLMQLVEQHSRSRAPIVQFADRVAGRFVVIVLALAAVTFGAWLWWDAARAVDNAVALLIVTCPCALGLATPLAMTIALGRAAKRHILIKGGETLELLSRSGTMFLDKTGTITAGQISVVSWTGDRAAGPLVAALERHSAHGIAQALIAAVESQAARNCPGAESLAATDVRQTAGGGIAGTVAGRRVIVGSPKFVLGCGATVDEALSAAQQHAVSSGWTPVLAAVDGRCVAVVALGDPIRGDAGQAIGQLRNLGWRLRILSGDHPQAVAAIAGALEIDAADAFGGVPPEEKVLHVRQARAQGPVVMIGDGVNDAAALSAAEVGIAVHGGAEASLAAAHVCLDRPGLTPMVELVQAARNTLRAIRRCLAASLCYNAVAASLAMSGLISPLLAAVLMPISSFTMLALAYSARTFGDDP